MKCSGLVIFFLSSVSLALHPGPERRSINDASMSQVYAKWSSMLPKVTGTVSLPDTIPTRIGNVDPPASSLMMAIVTGVPAQVLVQLVSPQGRSSIASEFSAGHTPAWYSALPEPVKSYIVSIKGAIATGGNEYTGTESAIKIPLETGGAASASATGANAPTSTKSKGIAAATSLPFAASLGGAMGILGLALAL